MSISTQNNKPIIGLTCNLYLDTSTNSFNAFRYSLYEDNAIALSNAGAVPIILPALSSEEEIYSLLDIVHGIMIVGGNTPISPTLYNSKNTSIKEAHTPILRHDIYNLALIHGAVDRKLPLFGICRGFEMINVAFGGSLCHCIDCPSRKKDTNTKHNIKGTQTQIAHTLKIVENTDLHKIVNTNSFPINSFHEQCINTLSPDLQANAYSEDGLIEGFEWKDEIKDKRPFMMALQGHPEMLAVRGSTKTQEKAKILFTDFIKEVKKAHNSF